MGNGYKTFMKSLEREISKAIKEKKISREELEARVNKPLSKEDEKKVSEKLKELGKTLREMREVREWSVEELAKKAKVPIASVQLLEAGVGDETVETIFLILKALNSEVKVVRKGKRK
jgi:hypothetical protein